MARPKYQQIADHYRERILNGELPQSSLLPSTPEIAELFQCAKGTVTQGLGQLHAEGILYANSRGTFVAKLKPVTVSASRRLDQALKTGSTLFPNECGNVLSAELVVPPLYVAEIFDQDPQNQVVRRTYIIGRNGNGDGRGKSVFAVDWHPAHHAALVPDLLSTAPGSVGTLVPQIEEATGRTITEGRDDMHARDADEREGNHLGVPKGGTILAGAHRWSDHEGVIIYGEWCLPYRHIVNYGYTLNR